MGSEVKAQNQFAFDKQTEPCFLEVQGLNPRAIRVNCFQIGGVLHIHSNRFAKMPRLGGESWVDTVRRDPAVRVAIADKIFNLQAMPIDDPPRREQILTDRGYSYIWDGITVFIFNPR